MSAESQQVEVTIVAHDIGPVGGMERQLSALIAGLLERGHRLTVISRTCDLPAHPSMRWVRVPGPTRPFPVAYPWFFLLGSLLLRLRGRGVVHTTGAIVLNRSAVCTVHFCHQAVASMPKLTRASRGGPLYRLNALVSASLSHRAERWYYGRGWARRLIGVSGGVARDLQRHFPAMRDRIDVIPNGVDTGAFHPARNHDSGGSEGMRAVFVGSEWERKGLQMAIEALRGCPRVGLIVVGAGDAGKYREIAERSGVGDRVTFAGATNDVAPWYRKADLFLLPTAYEAAPLVTYEAAASGLPLLATKVNGVEDLIRDGINGWFIERDPDDIRAKLRQLDEDPSLRSQMGAAAREDSLEFSWSRVVDQYEGLYRTASG